MKKLLFISDMLCQKNIGASSLSYAHLSSLKQIKNLDVDVISLNGKMNININETKNIRSYESKFGLINNLLQLNTPYINNKIIKDIVNLINKKSYDYVFIDNSYFGKLVRSIKKKTNSKVITFYHDVKRNLCVQILKQKGISYLPFFVGYIYNEKINTKYSDYNITLNKRESSMLKKYYNIDSDYELPIIINDFYKEQDSNRYLNELQFKILFVGAYYEPNNNGLMWFIDNVMPKINTDIELQVVGKNMDKIKPMINNKNVNIIGGVDDLAKYYNSVDFVIEPIFEGAGMKVKTAEAMMFGKTILATSEALEGYEYNVGDKKLPIFECNDAEKFIQVINDIYNGKISIKKYDHDFRQEYINNYSESSAVSKFEEILFN